MKNRKGLALKNRKGLTLVELIVAVTILMFGLLSIVGVSSNVARSLGESRSDNLAAIAAQSRFEDLASRECTFDENGFATGLGGLTMGTTFEVTSRGITERYRAVLSVNNTVNVYDTITWQTRRITRRQAFHSLIPCRRGS